MRIRVGVVGSPSGARWLDPGTKINIGSSPGTGDPRDILVPGRRALSRRALELYNAGDVLVITNFQRPESGSVEIGASGGAGPRVPIVAPTRFRQPIELEATISFFDGGAPVTVRVADDRTAADVAVTSIPDPDGASQEDLDLLVNCMAVYAQDHPGQKTFQGGVAEMYLPCVERSPKSNSRFYKDINLLKKRYGIRDPRALDDMLAAARAIGHVSSQSMASARSRIAEGKAWLEARKVESKARDRGVSDAPSVRQ